jgi:hypothetical protein
MASLPPDRKVTIGAVPGFTSGWTKAQAGLSFHYSDHMAANDFTVSNGAFPWLNAQSGRSGGPEKGLGLPIGARR